jgi:hypothetical protein
MIQYGGRYLFPTDDEIDSATDADADYRECLSTMALFRDQWARGEMISLQKIRLVASLGWLECCFLLDFSWLENRCTKWVNYAAERVEKLNRMR